jgi:hypothetical protein
MNVLKIISRFALFVCLLTGSLISFAQKRLVNAHKNAVSVSSELTRIGNTHLLPQYLDQQVVYQTSSYDTTGSNDDGFSGKYSFVRRNADSSLVLFEEKGNGVINRIWTPTPTEDILDFYFSGSKKPSYSIKFSDLFSGKVYPFVAPLTGNQIGGYFCYFPIPFKNGCKIVSRGKHMQFYQIQYRKYPGAYKVENFHGTLSKGEQENLMSLKSSWSLSNRADEPENVQIIPIDTTIAPGQTLVLADVNKGGRIDVFELESNEAFTGLQKQFDLKMTWDQEIRPAIYAPLADLFGYAFGQPSMRSLLIGNARGLNYFNVPMPFDHHAKIELIYRAPDHGLKQASVKIKGTIWVHSEKRNPAREGKFYANWNHDAPAALGHPHVFLEGKGRGHYVGTILQAQGLEPGMTLFFEGDDSTAVDGKMTMHGTGSEDYFNGGWYALLDRWDRKMSLPIHGSLDYSLPLSRTGGYRMFIGDKMPFENEFYHSIEHGPEKNNKKVDYTSLAFYYADGPLLSNAPQQVPTNKNTAVFVPDTLMLYPQLMNLTFGGKATVDGDKITSTDGAKVRIDLKEIPDGDYKLYADLENDPTGAEVMLWQRQTLISKPISFFSKEIVNKKALFLTEISIDEFKKSLTLEFKKDAVKNSVIIHRLIFIKSK